MVHPAMECVYFQAVTLGSGLMGPVNQGENQRQRHFSERVTVYVYSKRSVTLNAKL